MLNFDILIKYGMSNADLARKSGVHISTIQRYKSGEVSPTLDKLQKLKAAIGCSWDELLETPEDQEK